MNRPRGVAGRATGAWHRLRAQPLKAAVTLLRMLPGPLRRIAGAAVRPVARAFATRTGPHPVAAPLAVMAGWAAARAPDPAGAGEAALAAAGRRGTSAAERRRLARIALALDAPAAAAAIAEPLNADDPANAGLRAELALLDGRYTTARDHARVAADAGDRRARDIAERAERELRVLMPGWRPALPRRARPGAPVPGRVVHLLTNSLPWTSAGYTIRSHEIGRSQAAAGLQPHLATRAGFPRTAGIRGAQADSRIEGLAYHRLAPDLDPRAAPDTVVESTAAALAELVERLRPAVLHPASNHLNALAALAVADGTGIPVVYEVRGFLEETWASRRAGGDGGTPDADRYRLGRDAETAAMQAASAVVTLSETMREEIVARGVDPDRVEIVPNGVDTQRFAPRPRDDAVAARLGLPGGIPVVGYVSTLNAYEGVDVLVEAIATLRDRGRPVALVVVGGGPELPALQALAAELGLGHAAVFTDRVPAADVPAYLSVLDAFVVPRTADRVAQLVTPLKPYEAMAMERPLVVSAVDALVETVGGGERGWTFRPGDAEDLAATLERVLEDPEGAAAVARSARAWVLAERTWLQNGARYRALYERLGAA